MIESSAADRVAQRAAAPASDGQEFACAAARVAADNKSEDILVLDLRGLSGLADFFVLGTGTSERQMHAVVGRLEDFARTLGRKPFKVSDTSAASWILADYVDVVVHLFDAEHRAYYDLDGLWGDAPRIEWRDHNSSAANP